MKNKYLIIILLMCIYAIEARSEHILENKNLTAGDSGFEYASPEQPQTQPYNGNIEIQPMSVIAFFEK